MLNTNYVKYKFGLLVKQYPYFEIETILSCYTKFLLPPPCDVPTVVTFWGSFDPCIFLQDQYLA